MAGCTPNSVSDWAAYAAALRIGDPKDSCEAHFYDIVKTGAYVSKAFYIVNPYNQINPIDTSKIMKKEECD